MKLIVEHVDETSPVKAGDPLQNASSADEKVLTPLKDRDKNFVDLLKDTDNELEEFQKNLKKFEQECKENRVKGKTKKNSNISSFFQKSVRKQNDFVPLTGEDQATSKPTKIKNSPFTKVSSKRNMYL